MSESRSPVIVAFDGSPEARAAVAAAATLFADRPLVVVTVWEPGLALAVPPAPDSFGIAYATPSATEIATRDRVEAEHASAVAAAGADIAQEHGAIAEALPVPDEVNVTDKLLGLADERDAAAVVVGSRGRGAVRSSIFGSTSRRLINEARRPIVVVRAENGTAG